MKGSAQVGVAVATAWSPHAQSCMGTPPALCQVQVRGPRASGCPLLYMVGAISWVLQQLEGQGLTNPAEQGVE